ncbi:MAG: hypothetical protein HY858_03000 [Candidatus Solibacter usitatus]|nr:hypothetical protein [Candidatus Solibacter usitatus]
MVDTRRPSRDLWERTLSQIPTTYGRLVYLSALRNSDSGRYMHHGLSMVFGEAEADQAMRSSHESVYLDWLDLDLEQQKADLSLYLAEQSTPRRTLVENWIRLTPYRNVIPASATNPERALFIGDLELLLELLRNEYGGGVADRAG